MRCVSICIQQFHFYTVEAGSFLRNLKCFANIENVLINRQLIDLLAEIAVEIKKLKETTDVIETPPDQKLIDRIFSNDERKYCFRRFYECCLCGVSYCCCFFSHLRFDFR